MVCARIWGLAQNEAGEKDYGYIKLDGMAVSNESIVVRAIAQMLNISEADVTLISEEEYRDSTEEAIDWGIQLL
ncbi:hypothetical protein [Anaerotruncus massiliensis (ex Liu et al. 2021)]|uniref:hypothetical protein n=1 Tax=Anaerotruncus massiliensis (ex Liu et al. 2021) TaxID=2321404 RepID=UPI003AB248A7